MLRSRTIPSISHYDSPRKGPSTNAEHSVQVGLDRLWQACQRQPASCLSTSDDYLHKTAAQLALMFQGAPPVEAKQLRLLVRDAEYVESMRKYEPSLVVRPLAGSLWLVVMVDFPTASRMAVRTDLQTLKADAAKAEGAALTNLRRELGPVEKLAPVLPAHAVGYLTPPNYYNCGLLAAPGDWAALAKRMKGKLLVSVPTDEVVLFADSAEPEALAALKGVAQQMFREAKRPVSTQILQWSAAGWQPLP